MIKCADSVFKCFAKRFIPVAVIIIMAAFFVLFSQREHYVELIRDHEINLLKNDQTAFRSWLEAGVEDVNFLAGLTKGCLDVPGDIQAKYDYLANVFSVFGQENRNCVQVRLLSPLGRELVRINVNQGNTRRVAAEFLQDKSGSPYFKDAGVIRENVYISAFDLNKEHGKVNQPYLPVIRFMKNIYGSGGGLLGLIVVNLSGEEILKTLGESSNESFGNIYLLNEKGGWILSPEEDLNWRFLFGEKKGFMKESFPEEWAGISAKDTGQFDSDKGLNSFVTIEPNGLEPSFEHGLVFKESWKVVSHVDGQDLMAPWGNFIVLLVVALCFLCGVFFWRETISVVESNWVRGALEESEQRFKDVADAAGEFIWETGPDGCFIFVTGRARDILGYSAEELIGRSPFDFVDEESSWDVRREFLDAAHRGESFSGLVFRFVNREGRKLWLEFNGVPVFGPDGVITGFRGATSDITAQQKALKALQDREDMLQSISDSVQDALVLMDENGLVHFWNPAAENIFGYSAEEMLGESLDCCIRDEDNEGLGDDDNGAVGVEGLFSEYGAFTVNVRRKGGTVFPAEVLLSPLRRDDKWWVVGTIRDVTERKEAEDKLRRLATTDPLTGLANRRFFMESAEDALARSLRYDRELSLLMLDIDFFKHVNDMYGHDAGDDVLRGLAAAGLKILRKIDVFGRIGGEEFSILLAETGLEGATLVAERLRKEIESTRMLTRSGELSITVSIGVATLNDETRTLEHLLKAADIGLYSAKHAGRNRVKVQLSPKGTVEK